MYAEARQEVDARRSAPSLPRVTTPPAPAMMNAVHTLLARCGLMLPALRRSLWVHGNTTLEFLAAQRLIQSIMDEQPHLGLVVTSARADTLRFLSRVFVDENTLPVPHIAVQRRWLRRLQVRHLLLLDGGRSLSGRAFASVAREHITVSAVDIADPDTIAAALLDAARRTPAMVRLCVVDDAVARHLTEIGIPSTCIVTTGSLDCDRGQQAPADTLRRLPGLTDQAADAARRTHAALAPLLPDSPSLPPVAQNWRIPTWRDRVGGSRLWKMLSPPLRRARIDTWDALKECVGNPRTVLCLGNGPSSEDPRLESLAHDCLIRVNWRWKDRGFLVHPQIVFVGDAATLHKIDGAIFGIWRRSLEDGMVLRHFLTHGPAAMRYFTMERIAPIVRDHAWPARPTNGALMIAAAAALAPARLVIAGVDLYQHPEGRYPGDLLAANAYARAHTRETDLEIIRQSLATYRGEVIIFGDALQAALAGPDGAHRD